MIIMYTRDVGCMYAIVLVITRLVITRLLITILQHWCNPLSFVHNNDED